MTNPKTERGSRTSGESGDPLVRLCRSLPGATEDVKWGDNLIFSVGGKMFAGFDLPELQPLSFKVDPVAFQTLVVSPAFAPAPYLARHHWVTVADRDLVPIAMLEELITEAHGLVASKLSKKARQALGIGEAQPIVRDGVPLLPPRRGARPVTMAEVNRLRDGED